MNAIWSTALLLFAFAGASALAQGQIDRPVRAVGNSPLLGDGIATITDLEDGRYKIEVRELTLTVSPDAKAQLVRGFRVGLMGPKAVASRSGADLDELIPEEVEVSAGDQYAPGLLTGTVVGEPGIAIDQYEICVAIILKAEGSQRNRTHWIHYGATAGPTNELPELSQLRGEEETVVEMVSAPFYKLKTQYLKGLERLEAGYTSKGELEGVLATKKEVDLVSKTGKTTDVGSIPDLAKAQSIYIKARDEIAADMLPKLERWLSKQLSEVKEIQAQLTQDNRIDDATILLKETNRIQRMLSDPSTIPTVLGITFLKSEAEPAVVVSNLEMDPGSPFTEPIWTEDRKIGPGAVEGGGKEIKLISEEEKGEGPDVEIVPGTTLTNGKFFCERGTLEVERALFKDGRFVTGLHGHFSAEDSLFERTSLTKGGGWFVSLWTAKFEIDNCVFQDKFFEKWSTVNVGLKMKSSTLFSVQLPSLDYRKEGGEQIGTDNFLVRDCRFVDCEVPVTFLVMTKDCVFENCKFIDDSSRITDDSRASVKVYLPRAEDLKPVTDSERIQFIVENSDLKTAGSTLDFQQVDDRLMFTRQ